ncbi:hypothetical protein B0H13DRAFT_1882049 [Mycena leptocephala]|nr:hypothetical protein B0H13DRAFT_1882049 [Mycena leptocephala]
MTEGHDNARANGPMALQSLEVANATSRHRRQICVRVLAREFRIEPSLHLRFFSAQCGDGALKILDFSLYIREANAVRFKSKSEIEEAHAYLQCAEVGCFHECYEPSKLFRKIKSFDKYIPPA